jgi:hypothetical protein
MMISAAPAFVFVNASECAALIAAASEMIPAHVGAVETASARSWLKDARMWEKAKHYEAAMNCAAKSIEFSKRA